jgi:hypothetical protein
MAPAALEVRSADASSGVNAGLPQPFEVGRLVPVALGEDQVRVGACDERPTPLSARDCARGGRRMDTAEVLSQIRRREQERSFARLHRRIIHRRASADASVTRLDPGPGRCSKERRMSLAKLAAVGNHPYSRAVEGADNENQAARRTRWHGSLGD